MIPKTIAFEIQTNVNPKKFILSRDPFWLVIEGKIEACVQYGDRARPEIEITKHLILNKLLGNVVVPYHMVWDIAGCLLFDSDVIKPFSDKQYKYYDWSDKRFKDRRIEINTTYQCGINRLESICTNAACINTKREKDILYNDLYSIF